MFSDPGSEVVKKFCKITQKGLQKLSFIRGIVFFGKQINPLKNRHFYDFEEFC